MNPTGHYLAVFIGSKKSQRWVAWNAMSETERRAKEREGMTAWQAWATRHQADVVAMGGPLSTTKRVSGGGTEDVSNELSAFTVVRAASHEAAAKMFENHPHFAIFPGEAVEIMPILQIPGA